jgi:hypothetical protein
MRPVRSDEAFGMRSRKENELRKKESDTKGMREKHQNVEWK